MDASGKPSLGDGALTRAERRRMDKGIPENGVTGKVGCKFCLSTEGQYIKRGNRFVCRTPNCKGRILNEKIGGF